MLAPCSSPQALLVAVDPVTAQLCQPTTVLRTLCRLRHATSGSHKQLSYLDLPITCAGRPDRVRPSLQRQHSLDPRDRRASRHGRWALCAVDRLPACLGLLAAAHGWLGQLNCSFPPQMYSVCQKASYSWQCSLWIPLQSRAAHQLPNMSAQASGLRVTGSDVSFQRAMRAAVDCLQLQRPTHSFRHSVVLHGA